MNINSLFGKLVIRDMFKLRTNNSLIHGSSFKFTGQTEHFIWYDCFKYTGQTGGFGAMFTQQVWKKVTVKNDILV